MRCPLAVLCYQLWSLKTKTSCCSQPQAQQSSLHLFILSVPLERLADSASGDRCILKPDQGLGYFTPSSNAAIPDRQPKISIRTKREAMKAPIPLSSQTLTNCLSHQLWAKSTITFMWFPDTGQTSFVSQIHAMWSGASKREASMSMLTWIVRWH